MGSYLFINQYFWPDEAATAQLLSDLAIDLVEDGNQITILCGSSRYQWKGKLTAGSSTFQGIRIERVYGTDFGRFTFLGRVIDMATFLFFAFLWMMRAEKYDRVVAMTSPPLVGWLALWFSRHQSVPLILWVQDIYPEVAERLGVLKNKMVLRLIKRNARKMYFHARRIVVPGRDMKAHLSQAVSEIEKVIWIPNWTDLKQIRLGKIEENPVRLERGWGERHVLMYSGNLGEAHDLEGMLNLILKFQKMDPLFHFVLAGSSRRHEIFSCQAREMGIHQMETISARPREGLGDLLGAADAHLISQRERTDGLLVPSKFYGVVAAGRPIIFLGSKRSELGKIIIEDKLGVVLTSDQLETQFEEAMNTLLSVRKDPFRASNIRQWGERNADRKARTLEFASILR